MEKGLSRKLIDTRRYGLKHLKSLLETPKTIITCPNRQSSYYYAPNGTLNSNSSASSSASSTPVEESNQPSPPLSVDVNLKSLVVAVRTALKSQCGIVVGEVRLGGGVASYIMSCDATDGGKKARKGLSNLDPNDYFNDVDFIFKLDAELTENQLHSVRSIVIECFNTLTATRAQSLFVSKTVKVWNDRDRWTLVSLGASPYNVDLIFVSRMARSYQFSVDSFQIIIDPLVNGDAVDEAQLVLYAESLFGDIDEALCHVRGKIVTTKSPEAIRGGGLLRYCDLIARGFKATNGQKFDPKLEKVMCTRFFIDFPTLSAQTKEIDRYLRNHFYARDSRRIVMLRLLIRVIQRSSQCIMNHERRLFLGTIASFINRENAPFFVIANGFDNSFFITNGYENGHGGALLAATASI